MYWIDLFNNVFLYLNKGLMSYGKHPIKWSYCSNLDFKTQYNMVGKADWCMPGNSCFFPFSLTLFDMGSITTCCLAI